VREKI
jgi:hypothetical protein